MYGGKICHPGPVWGLNVLERTGEDAYNGPYPWEKLVCLDAQPDIRQKLSVTELALQRLTVAPERGCE